MIDITEYSALVGIEPGTIRKRICVAKKHNVNIITVLPGVIEAKKFGSSWAFVVDKRKLSKLVK